MNNGLYEHMQVFAAIAQARSLTGASIATGIGQTTISRQLLALEKHLGCRLFQRSTRAITLTEHGEVFLRHTLRLLDGMSEAEASVQEQGAHLRGRLRVACSNGLGRKLLIPALPEWQRRQPDVQVELVLSDQVSQVIEERVDVAFRIAALPESNLVARPVGSFERIAVAAPEYLQRAPPLTEPAHLEQHECILFSGMDDPDLWQFSGADGDAEVRVQGRLTLSSMDAIYEAVLAGLGVAVMPDWFWRRELRDGRVQRVLADHRLTPRTINAVTTTRQPAGGKVAAFIAFVEQVLAA